MNTDERWAALKSREETAEARVAALEHLLAALLTDPKIEPNAKSAFKAADASLSDSDSFAGFTQLSAARKALQEIKSIAGIE